jgi:hypothetical protein
MSQLKVGLSTTMKVRLKVGGADKTKEFSDLAFRYLDRAERLIEGTKVRVFPAK